MRPSVIAYLKTVLQKYPAKDPVYEVGSFRVPGQEVLADMRPYFPGLKFTGCDMRAGLGVDRLENVQCMTLPDTIAGTVICFDTLEHVEDVLQAMKEMYRILAPGGLIIISSVMNFAIHDFPSDYWRFTPKAFELMLKPFSKFEVTFDGAPNFPSGIYGWGVK